MGWSQGLEQVFPGLVSHCDPQGQLTPPCSPSADGPVGSGPVWSSREWSAARVRGCQAGSLGSGEARPGARPLGAPVLRRASGRSPVRVLGPCCCGPLFASLWCSNSDGPESLWWCIVDCVSGEGAPFCYDYSNLYKYTFLKNKFLIHSEWLVIPFVFRLLKTFVPTKCPRRSTSNCARPARATSKHRSSSSENILVWFGRFLFIT